MQLPAMGIQGLNLPGIVKAQQDVKTGNLRNKLYEAQIGAAEGEAARGAESRKLYGSAVGGDRDALDALAKVDPAEHERAIKSIADLPAAQKSAMGDKLQMAMSRLTGFLQLPDGQKPMAWKQLIAQAQRDGLTPEGLGLGPNDVPPQYIPGVENKLALQLKGRFEALQDPQKSSGAPKKVKDDSSETGWSWLSPNGERMKGAPPPSAGTSVTVDKDGNVTVGIGGQPTKSQAGKASIDLAEHRDLMTNMVKQGYRLTADLQETGAEGIGWTGAIERFADTAVAQGKALAKRWGDDTVVADIADSIDWSEGIEKAGDSAAIKSQISSMAYGIALMKNGTRPTDEDVRHAMTMMGTSGSPTQMARAINSLLRESVDSYATRHMTVEGERWDPVAHFQKYGIPIPGAEKKPELEFINMSLDELLGLDLEGLSIEQVREYRKALKEAGGG